MTEKTKTCPICGKELALSEFGIARSRKDGRNLYCKSCVRKKIADSRRALRECKVRRRDRAVQPSSPWRPVEPPTAERVRHVIVAGARTQREIGVAVKNLTEDEIGEALASLLLWSREIRTETVNGVRMYFENHAAPIVEAGSGAYIVKRKADALSFAAVAGLMPGKRRIVG